jgi:hypothetical protein
MSSHTPSFPLYHTIKQRAESRSILSYEEQMELCESLSKNLDHEGSELLYVLIKYYSILENRYPQDTLPYKPKVNKGGIKFDLSSMPSGLVKMIKTFFELHEAKMMEEQEREKQKNI